jgi:hypothetical protein
MYTVKPCEWNPNQFCAWHVQKQTWFTLFETREEAQEWCDEINARIILDQRKNAALEWALNNGVPDAEVRAALDTPNQDGLLAFEPSMQQRAAS